jgi:hypothetical protein
MLKKREMTAKTMPENSRVNMDLLQDQTFFYTFFLGGGGGYIQAKIWP